jgi:hypothetical protein
MNADDAAALTDFFTLPGNPEGQPARSPVLAPKDKEKLGTSRVPTFPKKYSRPNKVGLWKPRIARVH